MSHFLKLTDPKEKIVGTYIYNWLLRSTGDHLKLGDGTVLWD